MTNSFARTPTVTPEQLRFRARVIQAHLDRWSLDELMRGGRVGEPPHLGAEGFHGRGYDPNQPRVPAGHSDGGQWTSKGGHDAGLSDPAVISDATPDNDWQPGAQYAARRPARGPLFINGRFVQPTPGQAARLTVAEAEARGAIDRVREHDPNWRPRPSHYETVEGLISAHRADAQQARERFSELQYYGIGPGPYSREAIPARGPERYFTLAEREQMNQILSRWGCHTCGTRISGTPSGNAVLDHQPPTRYNPIGRRQFLLPHCLSCSRRQGGWIKHNRGSR